MKSLPALVIIDPQHDFLSQGKTHAKQQIEPRQISDAIVWLVAAARQQGRSIVWVTSHGGDARSYGLVGTWGSEIVPTLQAADCQRGEAELSIVKHGDDAFDRSVLSDWLQERNIAALAICGVMTNESILQTATSALNLGYRVEILEKATAASTPNKQILALRQLTQLGATIRHWGDLLSEAGAVRLTGIAGESVLDCAALGDCIDATTLEQLHSEIEWHTMSHRGGEVPRLIALQGAKAADGVEPLYRHPADVQPPLTMWTPTVDRIRRSVEDRIGHPLNHCLIQLYRHGRDWIGEHADKTLDLVRPSSIVNVSLGATRTMIFRSKNKDRSIVQKLPLPHGSLFALSLESNQYFYHGIEKLGSDGTNDPRISLTFRQIGTYYDPDHGSVWGTGAIAKTRTAAIDRVTWMRSLSPSAKLAKDRDEADRMLQLFRAENIDDRFDPNSYQPGFDILDFQSFEH